MIASERVQEPFYTEPGTMFRHGFTYSGHPTACAAGLANLDLMARERLVERVADLEPVLAAAVAPLRSAPLVSEVRAGLGLLAAIEFDPDARAADPGLVDRIVHVCRDHGVLTRGLAGRALQISPPYVITDAQLQAMAAGMAAAIETVAAASPAAAAV